jgi:hypothetical protein
MRLVTKDQLKRSSVKEGMEISGKTLYRGFEKTVGRSEFFSRNGGWQKS